MSITSNPTFMPPEDFKAYLAKHGITETKTSRDGKEVSFPCPFSGCDDDHRKNEEYHCSFNCDDCVYYCFKCDQKGNFITLMQYFDDYDEWRSEQKKKQKPVSTKKQPSLETQVKKYHEATREQVREYFNSRGINDESIDSFMLGAGIFGGRRGLMIPVFDREGKIAYVKLRRAPEDEVSETIADSMGKKSPVSKYRVYPTDSQLLLVGEAELVKSTSSDVLICEGELDRILAIQEGVRMPVVTGGGANIFKNEWIDALKSMRNIYICFDKDDAGENGCSKLAQRLAEHIPSASIFKICLPFEEGSHADLSDYFVTKKGTTDELFSKYSKHIAGAKPIDVSQFKELTIDDIASTLDLTIKHDYTAKVIIFLAMLLAYTESDQLNIMINGESSSGKSFDVNEVRRLFPKQDVLVYGKTSPTAFFYSPSLSKKDKVTGQHYIDLERRIMVFTEQPDTQLQQNLRSLLSHDDKRIPFAITNKNKSGKNIAMEGYILGFPSTFFCSANMHIDAQEQSRCLIISPDVSKDKVMASIDASINRNSDKKAYNSRINSDKARRQLMERILYIKSLHVDTINIDDSDYLKEQFMANRKTLPSETSREADHFISLVKAMALLNAPFRKQENDTIFANKKDVDEVMKLWGILGKCISHGVSPQTFNFYENYILTAFRIKRNYNSNAKGVTFSDIFRVYQNETGRFPNTDTVRKQFIPALECASLISCIKNEDDGREKLIIPLVFPDDNLEEN